MALNKNIFLLGFVILFSCNDNNNEFFSKLQDELFDSIKSSKSQNFDYQLDGLTPQNNYLIKKKLKFLTLHTGGEFVKSDYLIYFSNNDLMTKQIVRKITDKYIESEDRKDWNRITDTVVIYNYKTQDQTVYVGGKKINSKVNLRRFLQDETKVQKIKSATEFEFSKNHKE